MMKPFLCDADVVVFDLDDTLYKEIDFLYSAYAEIATRLHLDVEAMKAAYHRSENVFQQIVERTEGKATTEQLLRLYRNHVPSISLPAQVFHFLNILKVAGKTIGIISDGRRATQRNKIKALGLEHYIPTNHIVISEEFGSSKPAEANYLHFHKLHPGGSFVYIADNVAKDFITPNRLGWFTACLLDDGRNIHPQSFNFPHDFLPKLCFRNWEELL